MNCHEQGRRSWSGWAFLGIEPMNCNQAALVIPEASLSIIPCQVSRWHEVLYRWTNCLAIVATFLSYMCSVSSEPEKDWNSSVAFDYD